MDFQDLLAFKIGSLGGGGQNRGRGGAILIPKGRGFYVCANFGEN